VIFSAKRWLSNGLRVASVLRLFGCLLEVLLLRSDFYIFFQSPFVKLYPAFRLASFSRRLNAIKF